MSSNQRLLLSRRSFNFGLTSLAFSGLAACAQRPLGAPAVAAPGHGPLVPDPAGLLDLPPGFAYRIISSHGERMDDGFVVPDRCDGMGAFALDRHRTILVRNHELRPRNADTGPFGGGPPPAGVRGFDRNAAGPLPGGTTTLVYHHRTGRVESQHLSLVGTILNCAGGVTPWGSWLSCEENVSRAGENGQERDHGWVFEVPSLGRGLAEPVPLTGLGRFVHEAAAVDPETGIVYLTEDRDNSLFYRFLPNVRGQLARGGRLQALAFVGDSDGRDTRNWDSVTFPAGSWRDVRWIDLDHTDSPDGDDLRVRGAARGAVLFARGEGLSFGNRELYVTCTSGGAIKLGQIMRYRPSRFEGQSGEAREPGRLQNFVESTHPDMLNYGDNLTVAPNSHLIVCEDQYTSPVSNHLRGVTPEGQVYPVARLHAQTELAGACFSTDGSTLFVNLYRPGRTLAITGPWHGPVR
ncbi:alkaline phosphatase PhoX [Sphingosinicella sp. YJ22]|uniref:alkaline phosphatase PhoX n=1 Tax=Sphingosinicella sp. YJ22 TaxID=1104780 RepID=UPI001A9CB0C0|nr:alkaline phosphatase PhoX [Sphingosinicella sp. YJ22]